MRFSHHCRVTDSFTLVELLVVIGILAILTAAVVIVLNPAELLKQSRDSKRTTDLAAVNNALKILLTQSPDADLGNASTVYLSLADSSSTCGAYALPGLPSGWKYSCVSAANLTKADGTGWIPVNFANNASQLPALPADPQGIAAGGLYYAYAARGGRWEIIANFESKKYASKEDADGGPNPFSYEVGSGMALMPQDSSGNIARDPKFYSSPIPTDGSSGQWGAWTFSTWQGYVHSIVSTDLPDGTTGPALNIAKSGASSNDMFDWTWQSGTSVGKRYVWSVYARGDGGTVTFNSHWGAIGSFTPTSEWKRYSIEFTRAGSAGNYFYFTFNSMNTWAQIWLPQVIEAK